MFNAEHLAGARETGLHLVGDQQDAVRVADRPQFPEQVGGRRMEPALALHGFDDDRGDIVRANIGTEQVVERLERLLDGGVELRRRKRHVIDAGRRDAELDLVGGHLAASAPSSATSGRGTRR